MSTTTSTDLEARAAWSVITESSDTVAGGFVAAIGHTDALSALENPVTCITAIMDAGAAWKRAGAPGRSTRPAAGCHRLIREFDAQLVTSADDAYGLLGR